MKKFIKYNLLLLGGTLLCGANSADAASIYDNSMVALNVNMLSDTFMSYANRGENLSDYFHTYASYGTMHRVDEYGDDGSTLKGTDTFANKSFIKTIWLNANHINGHMHYNDNTSKHVRLNLATVGVSTKSMDTGYGTLSFGGFASYINTKIPNIKSNGDVAGFFTDYKYDIFGTKILANIGSLNTSAGGQDSTNSWVNAADEIYVNLKLDKTLYFKPSVYVGYTWVSSDLTSDYNFLNVVPSVRFIKEIIPNWYAAFSARYVTHFGGDDDVTIDGATHDGLSTDNYTDIGIDLEYNLNRFVFGGNVHKTLGGFDGLSTNLNLKYIF